MHSSIAVAALAAFFTPAAALAQSTAANPRISLILQGTYAEFSEDTEAGVAGVLPGPETELRPAGFSLAETELVIESNVDPWLHAWATVALENEDGETVVAVEEAYGNTLSLPAGLALKFGRFFSELGYLNHVHSHAWEFVDQPLVYRALLANQLGDDGVQLRWLAPTDLFFELGAEALRGQDFPAGGERRDGVNSVVAFMHLGGDVGSGGAWRLGLSHLRADADERRSGAESDVAFSGDTDLSVVDVVYKWAPGHNPKATNFVLNAEYFTGDESGVLVADPDGAAQASDYQGDRRGFYVQAIHQFMPRWRAGLRYDRLSSENRFAIAAAGTPLAALAATADDPTRWSVMTDFSPSEFSRLRAQYNRDESRPGGAADDQFFLQYILSLGAHAAHQF